MSCKVSVRNAASVSIVDLVGRITFGQSATQMRETLQKLAEGGARDILVNLENLSYLDSAGLGELVRAYTSQTSAGGRIKLLQPQSVVRQVLHITRLHTVFPIYEDETAALKSFAAEAAKA
jgi:anti-sigma B factor antagonist